MNYKAVTLFLRDNIIYLMLHWLSLKTPPCLHVLTWVNKGNNKITELRTILQRESQNS